MISPIRHDPCPTCLGLGFTVNPRTFGGCGRATEIVGGRHPELTPTPEGLARDCWTCGGKGLVPVYASVPA